jgi:hypothetical protein
MIEETEPLYKKVGRKYIPVAARWYEEPRTDYLATGKFRLTYTYADGGRRWEYDVTPATAPMVAAMMLAKHAMSEAIKDKARSKPATPSTRPYNKRELALIKQFRLDMGGMYPTWWLGTSCDEIASAAMQAVMEYKP